MRVAKIGNHMENEIKEKSREITFRIPKFSIKGFQSTILILLIIVGLLQTVQLFGLQKSIASAKIGTPSAGGNTQATTGSSSALPEMVGGC